MCADSSCTATPSQKDPNVDSSQNAVPIATDMMIGDLADRRPRFIVDGSAGNISFYGKYPPAKFPWLAKILSCDYAAAADVAGMRIYQRLAASRCS